MKLKALKTINKKEQLKKLPKKGDVFHKDDGSIEEVLSDAIKGFLGDYENTKVNSKSHVIYYGENGELYVKTYGRSGFSIPTELKNINTKEIRLGILNNTKKSLIENIKRQKLELKAIENRITIETKEIETNKKSI